MRSTTANALLSLTFLSAFVARAAFSQTPESVGIFNAHADIGTNVKPGSATYIPSTGQYVISGAGYNVWADHDEFQYVYKKITGDFILYTSAEFLGTWVN